VPREAIYPLSSVQSAARAFDLLTFPDKANPERLFCISFLDLRFVHSEDTPD